MAGRRALLLRYVNGLSGAAPAKTMGETVTEVDETLDGARYRLRQKLVELGCRFKPTRT